jgi:hypothetical protein
MYKESKCVRKGNAYTIPSISKDLLWRMESLALARGGWGEVEREVFKSGGDPLLSHGPD